MTSKLSAAQPALSQTPQAFQEDPSVKVVWMDKNDKAVCETRISLGGRNRSLTLQKVTKFNKDWILTALRISTAFLLKCDTEFLKGKRLEVINRQGDAVSDLKFEVFKTNNAKFRTLNKPIDSVKLCLVEDATGDRWKIRNEINIIDFTCLPVNPTALTETEHVQNAAAIVPKPLQRKQTLKGDPIKVVWLDKEGKEVGASNIIFGGGDHSHTIHTLTESQDRTLTALRTGTSYRLECPSGLLKQKRLEVITPEGMAVPFSDREGPIIWKDGNTRFRTPRTPIEFARLRLSEDATGKSWTTQYFSIKENIHSIPTVHSLSPKPSNITTAPPEMSFAYPDFTAGPADSKQMPIFGRSEDFSADNDQSFLHAGKEFEILIADDFSSSETTLLLTFEDPETKTQIPAEQTIAIKSIDWILLKFKVPFLTHPTPLLCIKIGEKEYRSQINVCYPDLLERPQKQSKKTSEPTTFNIVGDITPSTFHQAFDPIPSPLFSLFDPEPANPRIFDETKSQLVFETASSQDVAAQPANEPVMDFELSLDPFVLEDLSLPWNSSF